VHLGDRGSGEGFAVETLEDFGHGLFIGGIEYGYGLLGRKRRDGVLQLGEFVGDVGWQQVAARGYGLSELDEDRSEFLERETDALA